MSGKFAAKIGAGLQHSFFQRGMSCGHELILRSQPFDFIDEFLRTFNIDQKRASGFFLIISLIKILISSSLFKIRQFLSASTTLSPSPSRAIPYFACFSRIVFKSACKFFARVGSGLWLGKFSSSSQKVHGHPPGLF